MGERMQAAQIEQSATALKSQSSAITRGQWLGFGIGIAALAGAAYCANIGQPWLAAVFLSVPVMGVATALVNSHREAKTVVNAEGMKAPSPSPPPS